MNILDRKMAMKVAAQHAAKQAVELAMSVGALAEKLTERPARFEVDAVWARGNIRSIRAELDDLERLLAAQLPIEAAPAVAAE